MSEYIKELNKEKDPTGRGKYSSYFKYYKWEVEGEVYFPVPHGELEGIGKGDLLHFYWDGQIFGTVRVLRVVEDFINDRLEIWYDASSRITEDINRPLESLMSRSTDDDAEDS